jgi:hypothetical protein
MKATQTQSHTPCKHQHVLYVQVTVHRDNLRINNQQYASSIQHFILSRNSTCFGHHQDLSAVHVAIGMFHAGYVAAA